MTELNENQLALNQRINDMHKKWVERTKERILTLPEGEEKDNLTNWISKIENRRID